MLGLRLVGLLCFKIRQERTKQTASDDVSSFTITHTKFTVTCSSQKFSGSHPTLPSSGILKNNSSKATKIGTKFSAGHGLFNQFLMRTVLLNHLEGTLFYPQSLRHNICHINKDHLIPQALNILQASTSSPSGNTTLPTVSLFLLKAS